MELPMKEKILQLINKKGLARIRDDISSLLANSIRIRTSPIKENSLPLGTSKIGGHPDLPPELEWPTWLKGPLSFIAQFNMGEVSKYDIEKILPPTRILYFFYDAEQSTWGFDPDDRGSWRVLYFNGDISNLNRTPFPAYLHEEGMYISCVLNFSSEITLPPWLSIYVEKLKLSSEESETYSELETEVLNLYDESDIRNRLLGHPDIIQNEMQLECQLVSDGLYCGDPGGYKDPRRKQLEAGAEDWRLLLQIDSIEDARMMWGDSGRIYYWIRKQDMEKLSFENVWMILQCY